MPVPTSFEWANTTIDLPDDDDMPEGEERGKRLLGPDDDPADPYLEGRISISAFKGTAQGAPVLITMQRFTQKEMAELQRNGGRLYLWVNAHDMPDIGLTVYSPEYAMD